MLQVSAFDFDGTITTKDTLWEFLKFSQSKWRLYLGLLTISPFILFYFLKIISNENAKERLFSFFFKNWDLKDFNTVCAQFSSKIDSFVKKETLEIIKQHQNNEHSIFIISASIENWITPWADKYGITVLSTQIEVDLEQKLTGKFKSKNCYGQEKVNRLLAVLPNRNEYYLYAYGDSRGDKELIDFANEGHYL